MNRVARAALAAAVAILSSGAVDGAQAADGAQPVHGAADRAAIWRGGATTAERAPAEWIDGRRDTFAALTASAPGAVVRIGFEWSAPRPVAALDVDFLSLGGQVFEPGAGAATLELCAADGWFPAAGRLERDDSSRGELARFQEFGGVRWHVTFPRCDALGVRLVLNPARRDGAAARCVVREVAVADAPEQPRVELARGAIATALAGAPIVAAREAADDAVDEPAHDLARESCVKRSHDGVGLVIEWPRPRLVSELTVEMRQVPAVEWWAGEQWRNVLVRGAETTATARGGVESTLRFVPHAVTRLRLVGVDLEARVAVRLGAAARDDFARARLAWGDPLQEQIAEGVGEPDLADVASWLLPLQANAAVLGRPDDPVETLVTWNGTLHETEHGDEGPWDAGAAAASGTRERWSDHLVAFALDETLFGADPDATTRALFEGGRPGVATRCEHDGVVAETRAFVTAPGDVAWGTLVTVLLENEHGRKRAVAFDAILGRRAALGDLLARAPRRCAFARDADPRVVRDDAAGIALFATPPGALAAGDYESRVHWSFELAPGDARELTLFVPSVNEPLDDAAPLARLDPRASRARFDAFWDSEGGPCRIELPEAPLDGLIRQLLAQCRIVLFDERPPRERPSRAPPSPERPSGDRSSGSVAPRSDGSRVPVSSPPPASELTLKYGAYAYEDYFGLEEGWPTLALAEFGQAEAARRAVERMIAPDLTDPANYHHPYRIGLAAARAAQVWRLAPDAAFLERIAPRLEALAKWIVSARHEGDETGGEFAGLLPKHTYGGDIATPARSLYANAACWRGLAELAQLWSDADGEGTRARAAALAAEADEFRARLERAVAQFADPGSDPPFVPMAVDYGETGSDAWRRAEEPYPFLAADPVGNYWGLFAPLLLETGLFDPARPPATWIRATLERHGGQILGLARFHSAIDPVYGLGAIEALGAAGDGAAFRTAAYAFLAHGLAGDVFTGGEVEGVFPLRVSNVAMRARLEDARWNFGLYASDCTADDFGRATGSEPLSASAGVALLLIRRMLVEELPPSGAAATEGEAGAAATAGETDGRALHLLRLAPPRWLANGRRLRLTELPTEFGPLSFTLESRVEEGVIRGRLTPPAGPRRPRRIVLWLNHPDGDPIRAASFAGAPLATFSENRLVLPADRAGDFEVRF